jgi:hypothetical protein
MNGASAPSSLHNVSSDFLISPDNTNPQYYFVGVDRKPWVVYFGGNGFHAVPIDKNQNVECCLTLIEFGQPSNAPHLAWVGYDNRIRTLEWLSPCGDLNPDPSPDGNYETIGNYFTYYGTPASIQRGIAPSNGNGFSGIKVYPNPTSGAVRISVSGPQPGRAGIIVKNMEGIVVRQLDEVDNVQNISIDLSDQPSGIYLINVVNASTCLSAKVSKR